MEKDNTDITITEEKLPPLIPGGKRLRFVVWLGVAAAVVVAAYFVSFLFPTPDEPLEEESVPEVTLEYRVAQRLSGFDERRFSVRRRVFSLSGTQGREVKFTLETTEREYEIEILGHTLTGTREYRLVLNLQFSRDKEHLFELCEDGGTKVFSGDYFFYSVNYTAQDTEALIERQPPLFDDRLVELILEEPEWIPFGLLVRDVSILALRTIVFDIYSAPAAEAVIYEVTRTRGNLEYILIYFRN